MTEGYPEKLSSPEAAELIRDQLQSEFQRLEVVEPPTQRNNRQIIRGSGALLENPDSIGGFEFRQDPKNGNVTYVEFQDQYDPMNVRFVRFRLPGQLPERDRPRVNLDMWRIPGRAEIGHNLFARQAFNGRHDGADVLGCFVYGREHDLAPLQVLRVHSLLANLEDAVSYHIGVRNKDDARQKIAS